MVHALFLKRHLCKGNLLPAHKIFIDKTCIILICQKLGLIRPAQQKIVFSLTYLILNWRKFKFKSFLHKISKNMCIDSCLARHHKL